MTDKIIQIKDASNNNLFPVADYNSTMNRPSINGVSLVGNKSFSELGLLEPGKQLLWTNPSPTAAFAAQTITFNQDTTKYDAFIVTTGYANTTDGNLTTNVVLNNGVKQNIFGAKDPTLSSPYFNYRGVTFSDNAATFTLAAYIGSAASYNQNHHCIPQEIYGIDFGGSKSMGRISSGEPGIVPLWTNPSTAGISSGTYTLSDTADFYIIKSVYRNDGSDTDLNHTFTTAFNGIRTCATVCAVDGKFIETRSYMISGTTFTVGNGYEHDSDGGSTALPAYCYPQVVYGVYVRQQIVNNYNYSYEINGVSATNLMYPVGAIYSSTSSANPGTLFGGTWEQMTNMISVGNNILKQQTAWGPASSIASNGTLCSLTLEAGTYIIGGYNACTSGSLWLRINDVFQDTNSNYYIKCSYNAGWSKIVTFSQQTTICYQNSNGSAITCQIGTHLYAMKLSSSTPIVYTWRRTA